MRTDVVVFTTSTISHPHTLTEEEVGADVVCGKCEVVCAEMMETEERDAWFSLAPDRFYFMEVSTRERSSASLKAAVCLQELSRLMYLYHGSSPS